MVTALSSGCQVELNNPRDVFVDWAQTVYIADQTNTRIVKVAQHIANSKR